MLLSKQQIIGFFGSAFNQDFHLTGPGEQLNKTNEKTRENKIFVKSSLLEVTFPGRH